MTFLNPLFNINNSRPFRWTLEYFDNGNFVNNYWIQNNKFVHWTTKDDPTPRDVYTDVSGYTRADFTPMLKRSIGFLTTYHQNFYEDGKYTEVYNDPINYIFAEDTTYSGAYLTAEARIGNYRQGVRRHVTHLGGTLSEAELDMLADDTGTTLTSFPLMPPLPTTDFTKPFRTRLITSDVGYIDYIKTAHPSETATDRTAYRAEQGTGFRRFVYSADSAKSPLMDYETTTVPTSISKVEIEDLETVIDTSLSTSIAGSTVVTTKQFLPEDGEDVLINFPGFHAVKSQPAGYAIEMYDDKNLTTLVSRITTLVNGNIEIVAGADGTPTTITIAKSGAITIDAAANDLVITAGALDLTGDLDVTGNITVTANVDIEGTLDVLGATSHGV